MFKLFFVFGTRPEAIKLAPLVLAAQACPREFETRICVTAQHRDLLDTVLARFGLDPDVDLAVMRADQPLGPLTARILEGLDPILSSAHPDLVLVQGDTTTTFAAALAAFYRRIPVGHVEAGLRTGDLEHPYPEELNRVLTTRLSTLHFAPTARAAAALRADHVPENRIFATGNTGIDALLYTRSRIEAGAWPGFDAVPLDPRRKLVLVTAHRRESFGPGFEAICRALRRIAARPDVQMIYPVHPNPNVRSAVLPVLGNLPNVHLVEPQDYVPFVDLMRRSSLILTDSGGVQEEAPSFGKPVLVMRRTTERPEALEAGLTTLVGMDEERITRAALDLLDGAAPPPVTGVQNPFGDGRASLRILDVIRSFLKT